MGNVYSKNSYPWNSLSNFTAHGFWFRGIKVASMEGLLQSFKFENPEVQQQVATLVGIGAKKRGKSKRWWVDQTLYWQGEGIKRDSEEYQKLLDDAYFALFSQNDGARRALLATHNDTIDHTEGKRRINETILTRSEFTSRLYKYRNMLQREELPLIKMDSEGKIIQEGLPLRGKER